MTKARSNAVANAAKGDLTVGTGTNLSGILPVGANGDTIVADASTATGLKYQAPTVNTVIDAKGDLLAGTAADTIARRSIGANNTVLTADSAEATGMKWAAPTAASGPTFQGSASVQNPAQNVDTKVTFTSEVWDTDACYTSSTFTPNKAGYYQVNYSVALNDCGRAYTTLFKTGDAYLRGSDSDITNFISQGSCLVSMNGTTDTLEVYVLCQGAGARNVGSVNALLKRFDAIWIRGL